MREITRGEALVLYVISVAIVYGGAAVAMARYPDGFDWAYTVISRLASLKHNPSGGAWLAGALLPAMIVLWPVSGFLARGVALPGAHGIQRSGGHGNGVPRPGGRALGGAIIALRIGIMGGALLGLEGLLQFELSGLHRKGHEILALLTFGGLYGGVLGLYYRRIRQRATFLLPALVVILPLLAVCLSQVALYFDQRELGWVSTDWRAMGVPVWLSFAFWQWAAVAMLWVGLGHLVATAPAAAGSAARTLDRRVPAA